MRSATQNTAADVGVRASGPKLNPGGSGFRQLTLFGLREVIRAAANIPPSMKSWRDVSLAEFVRIADQPTRRANASGSISPHPPAIGNYEVRAASKL